MLKENPGAHGYELLVLMRERNYKYIVNFTKGSFYYNLQQLEEKALIERIETEVASSLKETHNYILTDAGNHEFNLLMEKYGSKTDYVNLTFYAAMLFAEDYDPIKFKKLVQTQISQTKKKVQNIEEALKHRETILPSFAKMLENSQTHHLVNIRWFEELLEDAENMQ
nr:helix-turn-helix transcriptional regulator [Enterococcus sp. BWB1-3]